MNDEKPTKYRPSVCFDFDGVINSYTSGWQADHIITDPPVEGIGEELRKLFEAGYNIYIMSCRSASISGKEAIWRWLKKYGIDQYVYSVCSTKPAARCYVDDRGVCFTGRAEGLFEQITSFYPWWEKEKNL